MIDILTVDNMRRSDAATIEGGVPGRELMARAGKGIFDAMLRCSRGDLAGISGNCRRRCPLGDGGPAAIVCGSGNNAGDGYVLAIFLTDAGVPCTLFLTSDKFSPDGKYYYDKCMDIGVPCRRLSEDSLQGALNSYPIIVDCLFGTGFKGSARGLEARLIAEINSCRAGGSRESAAYVVSVDINSGLNGDNGLAGDGTDGVCVESDLTVSIGSFQPGHFLNGAKDVMAAKVNCPIGIRPVESPYELLTARDVALALPERRNLSNKGTYGYVTLIGGSGRYCGAIRLAALSQSSLLSGAGVATAAVPASIAGVVASQVLESTIYPLPDKDGEISYDERALDEITRNRRAVAFGMGVGTGEGARQSLVWLLGHYEGRLIVDADGLTLLAGLAPEQIREARPELILTPHVKEFARLLKGVSGTEPSISAILHDPVNLAIDYAESLGLTLLLKGPATIVTGGSRVYLIDRGCPGMATAGSGDVLAGIACAFASYIEDAVLSAAAAAFVNGYAGELAQQSSNVISQLAGDTMRHIAPAITGILGERS